MKEYKRGKWHHIGGDLSKDFHDYKIEWTPEYIKWYVDGKLIREERKGGEIDSQTGQPKFPSQPAKIQFGLWDGGSGLPGVR